MPLYLFAVQAAGSGDLRIEYSVDDPTPYVNQQLVLTVKVRAAGSIDTLIVTTPTVVEGNARVNKLGRPRQYETVRDSRRYQVHEQRYTLVPGAAGMLRLSPVEIRGRVDGDPVSQGSAPMELEVQSAVASGSGGKANISPDDVFLEVEVDKHSPYVQEQVLYTVRVLRARNVEDTTFDAPTVSGGDAVIERVGEVRRYQASRDGRDYAVTERRYVVFPQTSGMLIIEPIQLSVSVPLSSSGGSMGFSNQPVTRTVRFESDARTLSVKSPPPDAPSPWLPARRVRLEEEWPAEDGVEVGTPISRHVTLIADELMASQLPELNVPSSAEVKSYPELPERETEDGDLGVSGRLFQTMAVIPQRVGSVTVPPLEIEWWNTATDRKETARLPARAVNVTPGASKPSNGALRQPMSERVAWWLSLGLGLAWLATLVMWWLDRRRVPRCAAAPERRDDTATSRRRAETRLRDACRAGDPRPARDAMLDWGRACWPEHPPHGLGALGAMTGDAVAAELAALQQAMYAADATEWQGEGLYRAVASFRASESGKRRDPYELRSLYHH